MAESRLHATIGRLYTAASEWDTWPDALEGMSAAVGGVSLATVRSRLRRILEKTEAKNLRELVLRLASLPTGA